MNPFLPEDGGVAARGVLLSVGLEYVAGRPSANRDEVGQYLANRIYKGPKNDELRVAGEALMALCLNAEIHHTLDVVLGRRFT